MIVKMSGSWCDMLSGAIAISHRRMRGGDIYTGTEPCDCWSQNRIGKLISGSYKKGGRWMNVATSDCDIASEGRKTHRRRKHSIGRGLMWLENDLCDRKRFFKALEGFSRSRKGGDDQRRGISCLGRSPKTLWGGF